MKKFKPIRVFCEENLDPQQIILGISAIRQLLEIAGATDLVGVELHDLVDLNHYHVEHDGHRFLHGGAIQGYMYIEDYRSKHEYINFLLTQNYLWVNRDGVGRPIQGFVLSETFGIVVVGVKNDKMNNLIEIITIFHELGHIYGLPGKDRDNLVETATTAGKHCPNACVMSMGNEMFEKADLFEKPFCDQCLADLQKFFKE